MWDSRKSRRSLAVTDRGIFEILTVAVAVADSPTAILNGRR